MARRVKEGDIYGVSLGDGSEALCRVLYKSARFRAVVLIGCYGLLRDDFLSLERISQESAIQLIYTSGQQKAIRAWRLISSIPVTPAEREMSRRTVGGEVWVGDHHLGAATPHDIEALPQMDVYGESLFLKALRAMPNNSSKPTPLRGAA